jgi:hypothetical protein
MRCSHLVIAGQPNVRFPKNLCGGISTNAVNATDDDTAFSMLTCLRSSRSTLSAQSVPNFSHHRLTNIDHSSTHFQDERAAVGLVSIADMLVHFLREPVRLGSGHDVFGDFFHATAFNLWNSQATTLSAVSVTELASGMQ